MCVERGEGQPDVVAPRGDTCATLDQNDTGFMGATSGAGGSTYGFEATGLSFVEVAPELCTVPYSMRMTGLRPQVGTAMLAWAYLR